MACALCATAGGVRADETIVVVDRAERRGGPGDLDGATTGARDRGRALAEAPLVTIVHPDDHLGEQAGLAAVLADTVGADVRSLGGLGAFSSLSVRGAASGHTAVTIDGVPVSRLASTTIDLGRYDLGAFDEVALYRGAVPVALGGAGVGGALSLSTRLGPSAAGERWLVTAGGGSAGARHLRLRFGDASADGDRAIVVHAGYAGADGDFVYFDDGGTPLSRSDDGMAARTNNAYDHGDVTVRGQVRRDAQLGLRLAARRHGIPGITGATATRARLDTFGAVLDGRVVQERETWRAAEVGYLAVEAQSYLDRDDEIGVGVQDRRYRLGVAGGSVAGERALGAHAVAASLEARAEAYRDDERRDDAPALRGNRLAGAVALGSTLRAAAGALEVLPALRLEALRTDAPDDPQVPVAEEIAARHDVLASPRLSARLLARTDLAAKASVGRYARVPTPTELFGDRGDVVGSPDLRAETGLAAEAGVVWAPATALGPVDRIFVEAAAFATRSADTIALVQVAGGVARPRNVGDAATEGLELAAAARVAGRVSLAGNYTHLRTRQVSADPAYDGKPLPRQPGHAAYLRVDVAQRVAGHLVAPWLDADWQGRSTLDAAALREVPARSVVGAGVRVEVGGGVLVGLEVRNLGDARVRELPLARPPSPDLTSVPAPLSDVAGYPLPGRTFYLTAAWRR